MSSTSRKQLEDWLKNIEVKDSDHVLDVGGSQKPIMGRVKGSASFFILDLPIPHEQKEQPDIVVDIQETPVSANLTDYLDYFDIAFCLEVAEYWHRPLEALENIARLLKPGGTLYISFQFIYPVHNPVQEDYLRYTFRGSEKLLEEAGFEIDDFHPRLAENMSPVMVYKAEGMKMAKDGAIHDATGWLIKCRKI